jgi:hypothetical protein
MSQVPSFSVGDGICNWNPTLPTDGESESALGEWLRFLQESAEDFALNEHNCSGTHSLRGIVAVVFADSPLASTFALHGGRLLAVDTSGGNVVINLDSIASWRQGVPIWIKKVTDDVNSVTINRDGTDTIEDGTALVLTEHNECLGLMPDSTSIWHLFGLGGVITSAYLDASVMKGRLVAKLTNQAKTSDAVVADDVDLVVPLLANSFYEVLAHVYFTQGGTGDSRLEWIWEKTFTVTMAELEEHVYRLESSSETGGDDIWDLLNCRRISAIPTASRTLSSDAAGTSSNVMKLELKGTIGVDSTGGNLKFQWAQKDSNANTTTVLKGSYIKVTKQ